MIQAVVGALSGVIASMGLGGGFVLLIWLTLHDGMPQREAQGVNLLFFLPIALISVIMHIRAGFIDKKLVIEPDPRRNSRRRSWNRGFQFHRKRPVKENLRGVSADIRSAGAFQKSAEITRAR